jgi:hypothetical protein
MSRVRWAVALTSLAAAACGSRAHITPTQGESYKTAFSRQAPAVEKVRGPAPGLDPQEANLIADAYRQGLVPKKTQVTDEPILFVAPPARQSMAPMLPPSVPKER